MKETGIREPHFYLTMFDREARPTAFGQRTDGRIFLNKTTLNFKRQICEQIFLPVYQIWRKDTMLCCISKMRRCYQAMEFLTGINIPHSLRVMRLCSGDMTSIRKPIHT